ncbi:TolC family outer membrane protein [Cohaesibacter gelatinilyticus]|uniref:Outer membrane protein n=1 Tax=Cohaesibacter gelatinilyticus TaxID=372072 RepID=A0A285NDM8_9HYPH|nr:TolC family outer membrane protein [Cohaesibacter gelatinilyticus]SNZ07549.1 outer membrane protein [Cohaesibacter gelatinilyticus]
MRSFKTATVCAVAALALSVSSVSAETLQQALALAYQNNPTLNAARAGLRATDENVSQALSGYRPTVNGTASATRQWTSIEQFSGSAKRNETNSTNLGLQVDQILFRGMRTKNGVKKAESAVLASRATLENTEQTVLFDVASAYMDVLQNQAILELRKQNVSFLQEQVRSAKDRFAVGETISTDVAQAEARLSGAISQVNLAKANLASSRATYQQLVGKKPGKLAAGYSVDKLFPRKLNSAISSALTEHPAIRASQHNIDIAQMDVKLAEGELLPTLSVRGTAARSWQDQSSRGSSAEQTTNSASIMGTLSVPIYQGGRVSSKVRQAKETLGQRRIQLDLSRDQVRAAVISAWSIYEASIPQISAAQAQVEASRLALRGVIEERGVGQRTTLDVLNSQGELIDARISLVTAQRDRIVASFRIASAIGRLTSNRLDLPVARYDTKKHYKQVRDKWYGLRTPDGR